MTANSNQPNPNDAVLGGQGLPLNSGVLGGLEGVKQRLTSESEEIRMAALDEALNYSQPGRDLLRQVVKTETGDLQLKAYNLLSKQVDEKERQELQHYLHIEIEIDNESSHPDKSTQPQHQRQLSRTERQNIVDRLRQENADNFLQRAIELGLNPATDLANLNLSGVNLSRANLKNAELNGIKLSQANLSKAHLNRANLTNANLKKANLQQSRMYLVDINGANLKEADLSNADLRNADLTSANLENANLKGANLTGVYLSEANLFGTQIDETTNLDPVWRRAWVSVNAPLDEESSNYVIREVMPAILERYRDRIEATIKPYLELKLIPDQNLTWWQSKFAGWQNSKGGFPYLPKGVDYPKTPDGDYLHLLAQINFAEAPHLEGFPKQGILQFYLSMDDSRYGFPDSEDVFEQNRFRILYFREPDFNEENLTTDFSFLPEKDDDFLLRDLYPDECSAIQWTKGYVPISIEDYNAFDRLFPELGNDGMTEVDMNDLYAELSYASEWILGGANCDIQMGGYRYHISDDPRCSLDSEEDPFDTLLFAISLLQSGSVFFYMQSSALARCDFSKILYAMA